VQAILSKAGDTVSWRVITSNNIDRKKVLQTRTLLVMRAMRSVYSGILHTVRKA
jgi:hypothetical protein